MDSYENDIFSGGEIHLKFLIAVRSIFPHFGLSNINIFSFVYEFKQLLHIKFLLWSPKNTLNFLISA